MFFLKIISYCILFIDLKTNQLTLNIPSDIQFLCSNLCLFIRKKFINIVPQKKMFPSFEKEKDKLMTLFITKFYDL